MTDTTPTTAIESTTAASDKATVARDLIRAEIRKAKGMPEGTIIRFDKVRRRRIHAAHGAVPEGARIVGQRGPHVEIEELTSTYAALFVGNRWYLTGNISSLSEGSPYTNRDFMDILALDDIQNVEIATQFELVDSEDASE